MPRKSSLGPPILRIEGLSDGIDHSLRDDFTGELWPQPEAKVPVAAQEVIDAHNRAKAKAAEGLLQSVGILPVAEGPRRDTVAELTRTRLVITLKRKDWRRI